MVTDVLITGVSGFVGRNLAKELIKDKEYKVFGLSRTNPNIPGLEYIEWDLKVPFPALLKEKFKTTTIIHCAAYAQDKPLNSTFVDTNILGTINALNLNREGKFVHISSSSIYDLKQKSHQVEETSFNTTYPHYNGYGYTKNVAEQIVLQNPRVIPSITLRPHGVYGEDDTTLFPKIAEKIRNKTLILPNSGKVLHSLTHINNLISAIKLAIHYTPTETSAFNITDKTPILLSEALHQTFGNSLTKIVPLPTWLVPSVKKIGLITEYEHKQIGFERTYNIQKAETLLGYKPTGFQKML